MKKMKDLSILIVSLIMFCFSNINAQSILMDSVSNTCLNSIINIPFRVKNFKKILGIQGSISWDTTIVKYYNISYNATSISLGAANFNLNATSLGNITYVWTDPNSVAETVLDSAILFTLQLRVAKSIIGSTAVSFVNTPTPLAIVGIDSTGGYSISKNTSYQKGFVGFISQPTISKNRDTLTAIVNGIPSFYQWNMNATPISGATSKTYTNATVLGGSYSVTIKYANGCVATSATVLPLTKIVLSGNIEEKVNGYSVFHLDWNNDNYINQAKLILEKSTNGIDFFSIKVMNTNEMSMQKKRSFADTLRRNEIKGFYRLLLTAKNGSNWYSNIAEMSLLENNVFEIYPIPAKNILNLHLLNSLQEWAVIEVKDILGTTVFSQKALLTSGINNIPINIVTLKSGTYTLIVGSNKKVSKQFIKQ